MTNDRGNFFLTPQFLLANLIFFLGFTANQFFILYPLHLDAVGKNQSQIGLIMGIAFLGAVLSRPGLGSWVDRYGRRILILWGAFLTAGVILLYALPFSAMAWLMGIRLLHGIAFAAFFTAMFTWAADYSPPERLAEGVGIFGISGLLTTASGTFCAEQILRLARDNYLPFYLAAAALTLGAALLALKLQEPACMKLKPQLGFKGLIGRFDILTVSLSALIFGSASGVVNNFMSSYSQEASLGAVAPFFGAYTLGAVLIRFFSGRAADRLGRTTLIPPALILMGIGQIALALPYLKSMYLVTGFCLGLGHGIVYPAINALTVERAGRNDRGAANAIMLGAVDAGTFMGSAVFGIIAKMTGFNLMFILSGSSVLLGLIGFYVLEKLICKICVDKRYPGPTGR